MSDVATLRAALAANLRAITDVQVSAYALAAPTPPGIQIQLGETQFDRTFHRGLDVRQFIVQAFVDFSSEEAPQRLLDELLAPTGTRSVKTALESDKTLGGTADGLHVKTASRPQLVERAQGGQMLFVEFTVEVHVSN